MEIHSLKPSLPPIPDDVTVGQFLFDSVHPARPRGKEETPWIVEDATGRTLGKQQLCQRTTHLASALRYRFGVGEDDVVLLYSRNHIDYPVAIWAVHQLGGIISGANPDFSTSELLYQLQATKAKVLIAHPDNITIAAAAAQQYGLSSDRLLVFNTADAPKTHKVSLEDMIELGRTHAPSFQERRLKPGEGKTKLAFLSFSSGTTGRPKAVAIPHYAPIANVVQIAVHNRVHEDYCNWEDRRYRPGDIAIGVLPFYHIYGLVINATTLCPVLWHVLGRRAEIQLRGDAEEHSPAQDYSFIVSSPSVSPPTLLNVPVSLVPPMVVLLCKHPAVKEYRVQDHIRMIMCGAAPLSHELNQQVCTLLPNAHIGQAYGMTETCTASTMWRIDRKRGISGGSGTLLPGTIARIVKPDGSLASYDEPGELIIYSPSNALCYLNNEEATRETFLDGWVRTGDEVKIGKDGEVWVLDRLKEIMKVKGFQVAPAELEGCILEHEDVNSTCVVGVPDEYSGEVPMAFVALSPNAANRLAQDPRQGNAIKASIMKHVADNKVAYKHLAGGIEFVDVIPTSPSGKLLRRVLRDRAKELRKSQKVKAKL